ncbi:hypothetical protein ASG25_10910 [Rhizobium sp. Leaf384]|uniref:hypothetical protein n=1 Tax=unclassified Rhizobium TaxID=2613769 RepID=UPI000713A54B|nr:MULTISPECIES: hypothetical protein [unclassified Rhizobium]KQS79086.1 hypothetical protein ASG25_10910 [Rhizobium sp. Leaf384]KQS82653.1 hypothetical protein ASG58_04725 [Rhizobium sp. Leaf383]
MPGTTESFEVLVFDVNEGEVSQSREPIMAESADAARQLAGRLAETHAGTIALSRRGRVAIGECESSVVLEQHGRIGDFD